MPTGPASSSTCCSRASTSRTSSLVLRARAGTQRPADEALGALLPVGWLVEPLAGEILRGPSSRARSTCSPARPRTASRPARCVRRSASTSAPRNLAALEQAVLAAHAAHVTATLASAGPDARTLLRFARREHRRAQPPRGAAPARCPDVRRRGRLPPERALLPGGSVPLARFAAAVRAPAPAAVIGSLPRSRRQRLAGPARAVGAERRPRRAGARAGAAPHRGRGRAVPAWATRSRSTCRSRSRPRSGPRRGTCVSSARRARAASTPRWSGASCSGRRRAHEPPARPDDAESWRPATGWPAPPRSRSPRPRRPRRGSRSWWSTRTA